jgi:hypothetical protein
MLKIISFTLGLLTVLGVVAIGTMLYLFEVVVNLFTVLSK